MQDRLPQSRSDAVLQARTGHITVLRELLALCLAGRTGPICAGAWCSRFGALVVAKAITLAVPIAYKPIIDLLTGQASSGESGGRRLDARPCHVAGDADRRLWRRPRADGGVRAVPRRMVHRGRPARGARARQPHLPPSARAVAALPSGAPHRRAEPRHRARRQRRRYHRAHGSAQLDPDRGRVADDLGPCRLVFRLDLRGGRAGHRRPLCLVHVLGERAAHLDPPRHERVRHRGALEGGRQPAQLRDGEIFRQ